MAASMDHEIDHNILAFVVPNMPERFRLRQIAGHEFDQSPHLQTSVSTSESPRR